MAFIITLSSLIPHPSSRLSQERVYPKEIRGYKLERAKVEVKRPKTPPPESADAANVKGNSAASDENGADALVEIGEPSVARVTPLGVTIEVPVTVAAVKQGGRVDFLVFEDMLVNGTPVTIEEYQHSFDIPNDHPRQLPRPVRLFISTPRTVLGALGELTNTKESWPVTGRVYVFGRFKKFLFKFKRVVPIELDLSLPNPLTNPLKNKEGSQRQN
jgi:hypothetical protein